MNSPNPLFLREEELDRGLELLYFAGRQLHADAAHLRAEGAMDEIDHQALFMIERHPGVTLAELCSLLGASKQTLSRHLQVSSRRRADRARQLRPATGASGPCG